MILATGLRSLEARLAKWNEISIQSGEWLVPGIDAVESQRVGHEQKRMKRALEHLLPLSTLALDVLRRASRLRLSQRPEALIFPSARGLVLSDNTLSKILRDGGIQGTPHGLRATLKTWCAERGVRDEVSEALLAHGDPDLTRAAYRRATYFDERRQVLQDWADYLTGSPAPGQ